MGFNNDRRGFGCASSAKTYTVEDYPLTLPDIKKLKTLSILGNSTQDGTPSPDNPVDVVGTGERTGNLFDISQVGDTNTLYNDGEKLKVTAYSNSTNLSVEKFLAMTGLRPGDVFTVARQYEVINGTANSATGSIRFNKKDGSGQFLIIPGNKDVAINVVPDDFNSDIYSAINFYGTNSGDLKEVIFSNIQILKGSYTADTLPPYEPYGYKVAVTASGRNLFKQTGNTYSAGGLNIVAEYQEYIINGTTRTMFILSLEKNINLNIAAGEPITFVTEILDGEIIYPENSIIYFVLFNSDNTAYIGNKNILKPQKSKIIATGNLPSTNNGYNFAVQCLKETGIVFNNVRIRLTVLKGAYTAETLPPYEPYKPPQSFNVYSPDVLHGVGAAHDTVILDFDKHKAELTQKIGISQFKNSDAWRDEYFPVLYKPLSPNMIGSSYAMCNYAEYMPTAKVPAVRASNTYGTAIAMFNSDKIQGVTDGDSFKTWLSDKDVYAYYPLATSTTTDITSLQDWDALPRLKGTWILTATGGTEPTLKAAYTSNTNPYPDYSNIVSVLPIYPDLDITGDDPTSERGDMEETEDQQETTSTDEPTSETNNSIDILDLYE